MTLIELKIISRMIQESGFEVIDIPYYKHTEVHHVLHIVAKSNGFPGKGELHEEFIDMDNFKDKNLKDIAEHFIVGMKKHLCEMDLTACFRIFHQGV